jgi:hypothetical protein
MSARPPDPCSVLARVIVSAAVLLLSSVGVASAADPPSPGTLDRPMADLALIGGADPASPPRLLILDTNDLPPGAVRVTLLARSPSIGWQPARSEVVALARDGEMLETPWLIELEPNRFALLAVSHDREQTAVATVQVDPERTGSIEVGPTNVVALAADDAGATDVDGDGSMELILASAVTRRGGATCQNSTILVLDGSTLDTRVEVTVPDTRLAGGVLGEWDGRQGGDLLAYAYANCPAGPDSTQHLGIIAIRLADGAQIARLAADDPGASLPLPGVPLAADLDADGHDELVVRSGPALVVLEPDRGWAQTELARGDVMPLFAAANEASAPGGPGTVAWLEHGGPGNDIAIVVAGVARAASGDLAATEQRLDLSGVSPARRVRVLEAARDVAAAEAAPQAWRGDIDGDDCVDVIAPLLTVQCLGDAATSIDVGATWFATRPILNLDVGAGRKLLVAGTMEWDPSRGTPLPATPEEVGTPGAWRHGPSARFALSEVRAADAAYFDSFPVPRPTIERAPVRGPATDFPGFTGARVLVRATSQRPDDSVPPIAPALDDFLHEPPSAGELVAVERVPVPPGAESGRDGSFVHVSLADVRAPDGGSASSWVVTIAQINDWGEIAGPIRGTIVRDATGPTLTVEAPFLSAPWPLGATLNGRSEPGVEVRGGSGGPVVADRRGRFQVNAQLAPWPQTLELTAVDETGNVTVGRFSVVGGVDYRAFPWPAIIAITLLVGAALSAGRGSRSGPTPIEVIPDADPLPEIEELPTGELPGPGVPPTGERPAPGERPPSGDWRRARP